MKNKLIILGLGLLATLGLASCGTGGEESSNPPPASSSETSSVEPSSSDATVHVSSVTLNLAKETAVVGEKVVFTVSVLPENATNKNYTVTVDKTNLATINKNKVETKASGTVVVTVTSEDGVKTDSKNLIIAAPEVPNITFTPAVTGHLNANVGEDLDLPVASARANGEDVTVGFSDIDDPKAVTTASNKFNSLIAGEHRVRYVAENPYSPDEYYDEKDVVVDVTAATPSTYDTDGHEDPEGLKESNYVYKDGFEKGAQSPLYRTISQSTGAYSLNGSNVAIMGNSLVVDHSLMTVSGTQCELAFTLINDYITREKNYKVLVEFDYKVIAGTVDSYKDMYFGFKYADGSEAGRDIGNTTFVTAETGHVSREINFKIPESVKSAWLHIFEHNPDAGAGKIAFDNFSIQLKQLNPPEVPLTYPTSDEVDAGYTFDFVTKGTEIDGNSELIRVTEAPVEARTIMEADARFGANVYRVYGIDSHNIGSLDASNLEGGDTATLRVVLYCNVIDDIWDGYNQFVILQMVNGTQVGAEINPTVTKLAEKVYQFDFEVEVVDHLGALNLYEKIGNNDFDAYIASIYVEK